MKERECRGERARLMYPLFVLIQYPSKSRACVQPTGMKGYAWRLVPMRSVYDLLEMKIASRVRSFHGQYSESCSRSSVIFVIESSDLY